MCIMPLTFAISCFNNSSLFVDKSKQYLRTDTGGFMWYIKSIQMEIHWKVDFISLNFLNVRNSFTILL